MKKFRVIFTIILIWSLSTVANAAELLIPGGQVIGLELQDNTVTVAAFDDSLGAAAQAAGLKQGDRILRIDNTQIQSAADVRQALRCSDGRVDIAVLRGNKTKQVTMAPTITNDGPRLGVYLKQGTTGVGTVTYYDPDSRQFAALGHGVNTQSGALLQLCKGNVYEAQVLSVKKGAIGTPGQLLGSLTAADPLGSIEKNTTQGVFGTINSAVQDEPLPVADSKDVQAGPATIRSTVDGSTLREYSVEILKIYPNAGERSRNMLLKVTDPDLLAATGGIVQGMGVSYNKDNQWNP